MFEDRICEKVELCQNGMNPFLIHEFANTFFVVGDHQFYKGYSLLLYKKHVREFHELSLEQHAELSVELYLANKAVANTYAPWKMNNQCLGNQDQHIHWHILPRYESDKYHKSYPFTDCMKGEVELSDYLISGEEAKVVAAKIRANLLDLI